MDGIRAEVGTKMFLDCPPKLRITLAEVPETSVLPAFPATARIMSDRVRWSTAGSMASTTAACGSAR